MARNPHDHGATPARRCRPGAQRRAPSWRCGAGVVADSGRHAPRLHRPPEPEAPPTRAGVASRGSFGGALAEDERAGSGRQRVKIRDATAARGGAGRDACRGETPAPSPGAKTPSATTAHHAAGRDVIFAKTPAPHQTPKSQAPPRPGVAQGVTRRAKTPAPSPNANIPSAPTPHPSSLSSPSAPPLLRCCRPPSPNPHNQRVGRPRERGERVILAGAQEESVARDAREDSGCAVSQNP